MNRVPISYIPTANPYFNYFSRTEIPCYSTRLSKKIIEDSTSQRLITFLNSGQNSSITFAVNALLSRSYQGKLVFTPTIQVQIPSCTLLDALISSVVTFQQKTQHNETEVDNNDDNNSTVEYTMIISENDEFISKVVAILRNSILVQPNDQIIAQHPTTLTFLVELLHNHLKMRSVLLEDPVQRDYGNTTRYILEILSKIAKKLPLREEVVGELPITSADIQYLMINSTKIPMLKSTPSGLSKKILETLEMALFIYDNDEALLAAMETLELVTKSKTSRDQVDHILLKPIYEPLFETVAIATTSNTNTNTTTTPTTTGNNSTFTSEPTTPTLNNNIANNNANGNTVELQNQQQQTESLNGNTTDTATTTPTTSTTASTPAYFNVYSLQLKQSPITFEKRTIMERLIELLGHSSNDIQLLSLNILFNLVKLSQKSRIMICHCSGLIRHLCNLLLFKTGDHNIEMGKKAASLLSYASKESLNLPVLMPFEPTLAQIALTDNPHTDTITNILIKLETNK